MARGLIIILFVSLLCGCGDEGRMDHPEDPQGRYHDQIAAARHLLEQKEDWAERAEWEVTKVDDGWELTAWRVEHPDAHGAGRYLPWGYSVIELDNRMVAVHYHKKG